MESDAGSAHVTDPARLAARAFRRDDAAEVGRLLERYPELRASINQPAGEFGSPPIVRVKSRAMLDVLLAAGGDINARSNWWAGSFGLLDSAEPALAAYAIERGATVTAHAAARLGLADTLERLIAADASLVHARGGDGQTPLHFASTIAIANFLLDRGADIDARDIDHESTPAQYMIGHRQGITRHLVERGCRTDLLMAAALGDVNLVRRHLDADPECIRLRVADEYFPMVGGKNGGTIYQWELGWYVSAAQVAKTRAHQQVFELLMTRSPAEERLLNACWWGDEGAVKALLAERSDLATLLPPAGRRHVAHVAHAAPLGDTTSLRLMLLAGLPVDATSQHGGTALHWAAWLGDADAVRLLLPHRPDLERADNDFHSTPLGWAIHGSENSWRCEVGDYPTVVSLLLDAGAKRPEFSGGTPAVRHVLARHGLSSCPAS